jgi:hypothetical protein
MIEAMLLGPHDVPLAVHPIQDAVLEASIRCSPSAKFRPLRRASTRRPARATRYRSRSKTGSDDGVRSSRNVARECAPTGTAPTSRPVANADARAGLPQNFDKPA